MIRRLHHFELDDERHELRRDGQGVPLQPRVLALLFCLVRNRERAVPEHELLDQPALAVLPYGYGYGGNEAKRYERPSGDLLQIEDAQSPSSSFNARLGATIR